MPTYTIKEYELGEKPPTRTMPTDLYKIVNPDTEVKFIDFKKSHPNMAAWYVAESKKLDEVYEANYAKWKAAYPEKAEELETKKREAALKKKEKGGAEDTEAPPAKKAKVEAPAKAKDAAPAKAKESAPVKAKESAPAKAKESAPAKAKDTAPAKAKESAPAKAKAAPAKPKVEDTPAPKPKKKVISEKDIKEPGVSVHETAKMTVAQANKEAAKRLLKVDDRMGDVMNETVKIREMMETLSAKFL